MSHELRTPLNAIIGFSEAIEREMLGEIAERRYIGYAHDIRASGGHLLRLINDILDLSRVEAGAIVLNTSEFALADAAEAVKRLLRERAEKKHLSMSWEFPPGLPRVNSDERILQQILINLVTNAIKFTGERGCVTVTAVCRADGGIAVVVSDNGVGMRPEDIAVALTPFGQVKRNLSAPVEGTGLGLPLCQRFAQALDGTLTVESELNKGTTVTLLLPASCVIGAARAQQTAA
jgi:signal transduction histidine kinase